MAIVFDSESRLVPTWRAAARHLLTCQDKTDFNLLLEIADPIKVDAADRTTLIAVDTAMRAASQGCQTLSTVASTIFPQSMYKSYGRPLMYEKFLASLERGRKPGGWGTYAQRMVSRPAKDGVNTINPLDIIINKLRDNVLPHRNAYRSAYELGVSDPEVDLATAQSIEVGAELPTYCASLDANGLYGFACLSHISFKLIARSRVNMVAIYRSHRYCERALGNLIGLAQLLKFVSTESGLSPGSLTCISTHAELDPKAWGGIAKARQILQLSG